MRSARGNFVGQALPPAAKKQQAGMFALQRQVEATSSRRSVAAIPVGSWSDEGAISHTVAPTTNKTYTANFTKQYYLTMSAGSGGSASPSSGWRGSGTTVSSSGSTGVAQLETKELG
jgi:hypothetical protein